MADLAYISEIRNILAQARMKAYQSVNSVMVEAYWLIGKRIVEEEQNGKKRAEYGEALLKNLSVALTKEFGKGFSSSNLRNFRQFYLTYSDPEICYTLCSKLTWSHNRLIMRIDSNAARNYYLKEASEQNWSVRILERHINTFYYERLLSTQNKEETVQYSTGQNNDLARDFIKDPYVFEFLNIPEPISASENDIEAALIGNLQQFFAGTGQRIFFYRPSVQNKH